MPDEMTAPDMTTPPLPVAPATQPAAPTFTQSDLDRVRAEAARQAHDAAWAEARKRYSPKASPSAAEAPQPRPDAPTNPAPDPLAILKLRDDFDDATADLSLPATQKKFLREQVMTQRPPDVAAFVRSFVDVWGKPAAPAAPPATSTPTPATPAPTPAMPGAAPPATPVVTADTPLLTILRTDPSQIDALAARDPAGFAKRLVSEFRGVRVPLRR